MFGSVVLDICIGLVLVFLVFSLLLTAINESIESLMKTRARNLERGIADLLKDPDGTGARAAFYNHPLIFALYRGNYVPSRFSPDMRQGVTDRMMRTGRNLPSYIPGREAAEALIDIFRNDAFGGPAKAALDYIARDFGADPEAYRLRVEQWFDTATDRLSGAYKRHTQQVTFFIGLVLAIGLNLNAALIVTALKTSGTLSDALVAVAGNVTPPPAGSDAAPAAGDTGLSQANALFERIEATGLPIGWGPETRSAMGLVAPPERPGAGAICDLRSLLCRIRLWTPTLLWYLPGWLAMAVAGSIGAPFWFDLLARFINVRATLKPPAEPQKVAMPDTGTATGKGEA